MTLDSIYVRNNLTLDTKVYHPFYGEGVIQYIHRLGIKVSFSKKKPLEFSCIEQIHDVPKISELYLKPIKIVEI